MGDGENGSLVGALAAVLVASLFWGSNFVVCKNYDMGDGMVFQLLMCVGIMLTGVFTLFFAPQEDRADIHGNYDAFPFPDFEVVFSTEGLLGGIVWCLGNLLTVPIVNAVGIGIGLSIWSGTCLLLTWVWGRVSIFGLVPDHLSSVAFGVLGIVLSAVSLIFFSISKKTVEQVSESEESLLDVSDLEGSGLLGTDNGSRAKQGSDSSVNKGLLLAFIAGMLYSFQFVPFQIHNAQHKRPENVSSIVNSLRFFFSQFVGIFCTSVLAFVAYCIVTRNRPSAIPEEAILPSIVSGVMWSIGSMSSMIATEQLGLTVGFPLVGNGAFLVNCAWACLYFKEVQGKRSLRLFGAAVVSSILGVIFLSLSR